MLPSGGNAMSWWWYDHLDPHNLYDRFTALSAFAAGLDRRGGAWSLQAGRFASSAGARKLVALVSTNTVLAYAYDPAILPWAEPAPAPVASSAILTFDRIADGEWTVETWDTSAGRVLASSTVTAAAQALSVPFDMPGPDIALRLGRADASPAAGPAPHLVLDPWDLQAGGAARRVIEIPRRDPPPAIDAALSDWGGLPSYVVDAPYGTDAGDRSFRFSVCHDGTNLYVSIVVRDDELIRAQTDAGSLWKDDGVELWLDTRNDAGYFKGLPHNPGCYQVNFRPALEPGQETGHVVYRHPTLNNQPLPGVVAASRRTADGYALEAALPLTAMRGTPWESPRKIGFNISIGDADRKDGKDTWNHLLWKGRNEWNAEEWSVGVLE